MKMNNQTSTMRWHRCIIFLSKEEPYGNFRSEKHNNQNFFKNSMDQLNSTIGKTEVRVSEFEDKSVEIIKYEQQSVS